MIYLQLIWAFFRIGLLSFGGGYAVLPMIDQIIVDQYGWMTAQQFTDIITISQMTPGPIAINAATFVGNQLLGVPGGIVATIGVCLPSLIIVLALAYFYFKYQNLALVQGVVTAMRPAVVALIASAGFSIILTAFFGSGEPVIQLSHLNGVSVAIFLVSLFLLRRFKLDPTYIIIITGIIGLVVYSIL